MRKGLLISASATALLVAGAAHAGTVYEGDNVTAGLAVGTVQGLQFSSNAGGVAVVNDGPTLSGTASGDAMAGLSWSILTSFSGGSTISLTGDFGTVALTTNDWKDNAVVQQTPGAPTAGPDYYSPQEVSPGSTGLVDIPNDDGGGNDLDYSISQGPISATVHYDGSTPGSKPGPISAGAQFSQGMITVGGGFESNNEETTFAAGANATFSGATVGGYFQQYSGALNGDGISHYGAGASYGLGDGLTVGGHVDLNSEDTTRFQGGVTKSLGNSLSVGADANYVSGPDESDVGVLTSVSASF